MNTEQSKVTAVSFSGGGSCGARLIAAAERHRSDGIQRWMGCSIGAFIAIMIANGFSEQQMKIAMYKLWHPSALSVVRALAPKCINLFKLVKGDENEFQKIAAYFGLIDQSDHIKRWCKGLQWNNAEFVLFDLISRKLIVVDGSWGIPLDLALSATMAVPGFFSPKVWFDCDGRKYLFVDGGIRHCSPTVKGHKTAVVKCMSFPGRDWLWPDSAGDVIEDIGVMPGLDVLLPLSKKEIDMQVRTAHQRLAALGT